MERGGEGRHGNGMHDLVDSTTSAVGGFSHTLLYYQSGMRYPGGANNTKIPKDPGWVNHIFLHTSLNCHGGGDTRLLHLKGY